MRLRVVAQVVAQVVANHSGAFEGSDAVLGDSVLFQVLKPGGRFVINDVAALAAYDRDDAHKSTLIQHTHELTVFGGLWYYQCWEDTYRDAGFELVSSVGRPAVELIKKEVALFSRYGAVFRFPAKLHVIPKKTDALLQRMNKDIRSYIQAEEEELLTLNWHCVGQKPARCPFPHP